MVAEAADHDAEAAEIGKATHRIEHESAAKPADRARRDRVSTNRHRAISLVEYGFDTPIRLPAVEPLAPGAGPSASTFLAPWRIRASALHAEIGRPADIGQQPEDRIGEIHQRPTSTISIR